MKHVKCLLVLLLSLTLILPMLNGTALADYNETNSYALNYNGQYDGPKWQYFSPYYPAYVFHGNSGVAEGCISFSLYNTSDGTTVIPTYCVDLDTGLDNNSNFRRINLEDSTYAASSAGVLRSVMLMGYPNVSVETLGNAAGVENLTVGEAVAATQTAIWKVAHGSILEFTDFCDYIDTAWNPTQTAHYTECNAEIENGYAASANEQLIESHINAVYAYLINLAPTAPNQKAVSNTSFTNWSASPTLTANEDGTYNVTVNASTSIGGSANVTLSAYMANGAYSASTSISAGNDSKTLTIQNVPAELAHGEVTLAIDGTQTVSDVFLFDAVGDRGSSQSLIGIDNSTLPVHAEITVQPERVINFEKHKDSMSGPTLEGIHFDIYFQSTLENYLNGGFTLSKSPSAPSSTASYTVVTDSNGRASFSLTKNNLPDGVYLIVERDHPAISVPVDPFYVILPATNEAGTGYDYVINIYPKNTIAGDIDIEKDVTTLGNDSSNVDAATPHTWIISATIPKDIAQGERYVITDTLDYRLDYIGNVKVHVETVEGTVVENLVADTDYTLNVSNVETPVNGGETDSFTLSLTNVGMTKVFTATATQVNKYRIRVYFDAQLNGSAQINTQIPNQATVDYTNSLDFNFDDESDEPVVYTGGIQLEKVDGNNVETKLAGAVFEVYRTATAEEIAGTNTVTTKMVINNVEIEMVKVTFRNAELNGELVTSATSDENGLVYIYGLKNGTYYVVETKAPDGYNLLQEPIELVVGPAASTADAEAGEGTESDTPTETTVVMPVLEKHQVENRAGAVLPETGGMGTTLLYVGGSLLLLMAFVSLIAKRKAC